MAEEARLYESEVQFVRGVVQRLESRPSLPPLVPQAAWRDDLTSTLTGMGTADMFAGHTLADPEYGDAVRSGLLLWNDALDESHTISQSIENTTGSYWHGIMHRREGDFSNSKYWFHKVGKHPVFTSLGTVAQELLRRIGGGKHAEWAAALKKAGGWDPYAFIDWCEEAAGTGSMALETIQLYEMQLLLAYSEEVALGRKA